MHQERLMAQSGHLMMTSLDRKEKLRCYGLDALNLSQILNGSLNTSLREYPQAAQLSLKLYLLLHQRLSSTKLNSLPNYSHHLPPGQQ